MKNSPDASLPTVVTDYGRTLERLSKARRNGHHTESERLRSAAERALDSMTDAARRLAVGRFGSVPS